MSFTFCCPPWLWCAASSLRHPSSLSPDPNALRLHDGEQWKLTPVPLALAAASALGLTELLGPTFGVGPAKAFCLLTAKPCGEITKLLAAPGSLLLAPLCVSGLCAECTKPSLSLLQLLLW